MQEFCRPLVRIRLRFDSPNPKAACDSAFRASPRTHLLSRRDSPAKLAQERSDALVRRNCGMVTVYVVKGPLWLPGGNDQRPGRVGTVRCTTFRLRMPQTARTK